MSDVIPCYKHSSTHAQRLVQVTPTRNELTSPFRFGNFPMNRIARHYKNRWYIYLVFTDIQIIQITQISDIHTKFRCVEMIARNLVRISVWIHAGISISQLPISEIIYIWTGKSWFVLYASSKACISRVTSNAMHEIYIIWTLNSIWRGSYIICFYDIS